MEETKSENQQEEGDHEGNNPESSGQRQKRRNRNDPNNRNFNCGCGKSYLSYPALYTHLKQKHEGKPPQGTTLPQNNGKGSRGRPPKDPKDGVQGPGAGGSRDDSKSDTSSEVSDTLDEFFYLLSQIKDHRKENRPGTSLDINSIEPSKLLETFPKRIFKDTSDYLPIYRELENIQYTNGSQGLGEEPINDKGAKTTVCNRIFAIFLYNVSKNVNPDCFIELCFFVCMYRKALNEKGWDIKQGESGLPDINREKDFCAVNNGELVLEISNNFVSDHLPQYLKEYDVSNFFIIGEGEEKMKNVVYITQHFCNWMFNNKYTNSKLEICTEDI